MRQLFLQTFYHPECEMREMRGLPAYQRIALVLESKIAGREWEPGQKIPAESDLAAEYGVSVMTARQALSELASSGLLERRQGHGTFVAMAAGQSRAPKTVDLSASMTEATHATQAVPAQLIDADTVRGPKWVFDALGLSDEDSVMRVRRIRASPEGPLSFTVSYMPESLGSALTTDDLYEDSLVGRLEERQHMHFPHAIQTIQATVADPESAEALQVATGTPLLLVERSYQLDTGQVVYISVARYPSTLFHYRVLLTRDSPSIEDWSVAGRTTN